MTKFNLIQNKCLLHIIPSFRVDWLIIMKLVDSTKDFKGRYFGTGFVFLNFIRYFYKSLPLYGIKGNTNCVPIFKHFKLFVAFNIS